MNKPLLTSLSDHGWVAEDRIIGWFGRHELSDLVLNLRWQLVLADEVEKAGVYINGNG
jgi:hypothetical protein